MRKLITILLLLFCAAFSATAETPAVDEAILGGWVPVLPIIGSEIHSNARMDEQLIVITADGIQPVGYPSVPILYSSAAQRWYMPSGTDDAEVFLIPDSYGQLIMHSGDETVILRREDAAPAELPPAVHALAYGGTWQATALYVHSNLSSSEIICVVDFTALGLPPVTIEIPAFADYQTLQQAWAAAVSQQEPGSPLRSLQQIYGEELRGPDTLLLVSRHGLIVLERISAPAVDEAIAAHAAQLANWWRLMEVTVGGIAIPPEAVGITDDSLAIDEQGNVLMEDSIASLQLVDGQLCIGSYPLRYEGTTLYLQLTDGVEARFITEAAWYRQQLVGTWQLSKVEIPTLDTDTRIDPAALNVQLIIQPDGAVILRSAGEETAFTLESTPDVIRYLLVGPGTHTLTISSLSTLRLSNESETYTLWFKPAE